MRRFLYSFGIAIVVAFWGLCLVSCGVSRSSGRSGDSSYKTGKTMFLSGKVLQTLDQRHALVSLARVGMAGGAMSEASTVFVLKPEDCDSFFFDGLRVRGNYVFIGIFQYRNARKEYRTIPVFIEAKYYIEGMEWNRRLLDFGELEEGLDLSI